MAGVHSTLAPESTSTAGALPGRGIGVAMQGRTTLGRRPIRSSADAIVAPVFPAETMADARPSRTSSAIRTREESFFRRTPAAGSSATPVTSGQEISSKPRVSPTSSGGPTRTTGTPSAAAWRAPATISLGALSPPIASRATGSDPRASAEGRPRSRAKSVDLDRRPALVPTAVRADHVGYLHGLTVRADAAGRALEPPVGGLAAAPLGLRALLFGDGHRRSPGSFDRAAPQGTAAGRSASPTRPAGRRSLTRLGLRRSTGARR